MKQKRVNDTGFISLNKDNFHMKWEGIDFGLIAGRPVCSTIFESKDIARSYFLLHKQFLLGLVERINIFIDNNECRNWMDIRIKNNHESSL